MLVGAHAPALDSTPRREAEEGAWLNAEHDRQIARLERGGRARRDAGSASSRGIAMLALCVGRRPRAHPGVSACSSGPSSPRRSSTALIAGPLARPRSSVCSRSARRAASPAWNMGVDEPRARGEARLIVLGAALAVAGAWLRAALGRPLRAPAPARLGRRRRRRLAAAGRDAAPGDRGDRPGARRHLHGRRDPRGPGVADRDPRPRAAPTSRAIEERMRTSAAGAAAVAGEVRAQLAPHPPVVAEDPRRGAAPDGDLAGRSRFLRSLGLRSSIVIPIRARDRNLGALTLISAWSKRQYTPSDVRFAQILASRIGLALDNAGLFSDLESIERRMDTVMSILDEAIVIHGADGELVFANPAAARMLGYETSEEAIASPTGAIRERYVDPRRARRRGPAGGARGQARAHRRRGGAADPARRSIARPAASAGRVRSRAAIEGPAGEVLYSVTAIEDVTDVKRSEFANGLLARTGELVSHSVDYRATLERVPELMVPSSPIGARSRSRPRTAWSSGSRWRTATRRCRSGSSRCAALSRVHRLGHAARRGASRRRAVLMEWPTSELRRVAAGEEQLRGAPRGADRLADDRPLLVAGAPFGALHLRQPHGQPDLRRR